MLTGFAGISMIFASLAVAQTSTTQTMRGTATVTQDKLAGTVSYVDGNTLVVKMASGNIRSFTVPEYRKFIIDGHEQTVHDLKPGTTLNATITTITRPVVERTVTNLAGKVWYVAGPNVILTLPDGTNKQYNVKPDVKFKVDGQPATVFDLRKGMNVVAEKVVEEPTIEVASDTRVTGSAPRVKEVAIQTPAPAPAPAPVRRADPAPAPEPVQVAAAPAPAPAPQPAADTATQLPRTGSSLPLVGLMGLLLVGFGLTMRLTRRY
jgi:hypothetical protein